MAGNGELIRSLRMGGSTAADAAREIARQGTAGQLTLTPPEAVEVRGLIEAPELRDHFTPEVKASLERLGSSSPNGTQQPASPVKSLVPSLQQVTDARQLPSQFEKDLAVVKQQLVEHPGLTGKEQSARLFEFFTNYAERLATVVSGARESSKDQSKGDGGSSGQGGQAQTFKLHVPPDMVGPTASQASDDLLYAMKQNVGPAMGPLSASAKAGVLKEFEQVLSKAGFAEMRDAKTGRSGLDVARDLLTLATANAVRDAAQRAQIDVHVRMQSHPTSTVKIDPSLAMEAMRNDGTLQAGKSRLLPGLKVDEQDRGRDGRGKDKKGSDGRILGSHLLWNVLHRYRDVPDDPELAAQQDRLTEVAVAAGLGFVALGVIALVWMLF